MLDAWWLWHDQFNQKCPKLFHTSSVPSWKLQILQCLRFGTLARKTCSIASYDPCYTLHRWCHLNCNVVKDECWQGSNKSKYGPSEFQQSDFSAFFFHHKSWQEKSLKLPMDSKNLLRVLVFVQNVQSFAFVKVVKLVRIFCVDNSGTRPHLGNKWCTRWSYAIHW